LQPLALPAHWAAWEPSNQRVYRKPSAYLLTKT